MIRNPTYKFLGSISRYYLHFTKRNLRVLAYHKIRNSANFENQLVYLKRNFNIISIRQLYDHLYKDTSLPIKPLLITFDDGDKSVLNKGLPLFETYGIPAVMFVITDLINTNKPFWWEEVKSYLGNEEGEKQVWRIKEVSNIERLNYLKNLREKFKDKTQLNRPEQLTSEDINLLKAHNIAICNHSHSHPMFDKCSKEELEFELNHSIKTLNDLDCEPYYFAYPNGNNSERTEKILAKIGIRLCFLFDHKLNNNKNINSLRISRIRVDSDDEFPEFVSKVSGLHSLIHHQLRS